MEPSEIVAAAAPVESSSVSTEPIVTDIAISHHRTRSTKGAVVFIAPLQTLPMPASLPLARPLGGAAPKSVGITYSGLDVLHNFFSPVERKEVQVLVTKEPHHDNAIQIIIYLSMDSINEAAEIQLMLFDDWDDIRTNVLSKELRKNYLLDRLIVLEITVLWTIKAKTIT